MDSRQLPHCIAGGDGHAAGRRAREQIVTLEVRRLERRQELDRARTADSPPTGRTSNEKGPS